MNLAKCKCWGNVNFFPFVILAAIVQAEMVFRDSSQKNFPSLTSYAYLLITIPVQATVLSW